MFAPPLPEFGALAAQLLDEGAPGPIVGIVAHLEPQALDCGAGLQFPVGEQGSRLIAEEHPAGVVALCGGHGGEVGEQGVGHPVARQYVGSVAEYEGGEPVEGIEQLVDPGAHPLHGDAAPSLAGGRPSDQMAEVCPAGGVEIEGARDGVDDTGRGSDPASLLEPGVVVGRYPGQQSDLLAAQTGHPPDPVIGRQAGPGGIGLGAGAPQEIGQFPIRLAHGSDYPGPGTAVPGSRRPTFVDPRSGWAGYKALSSGNVHQNGVSAGLGRRLAERRSERRMTASAPATWFVTGASRGLGLELVKQLLDRGDNVTATTRSAERLYAGLAGADTSRLLVLTVDLADEAQVRDAVRHTLDRF